DVPATGSHYPDERVADRRVSQVADVRGLVRIDVRVLDNDFPAIRRHTDELLVADQFGKTVAKGRGAVEEEIDVTGSRDLDFLHAGNGAGCGDQLLRNSFGRLLQSLCQLKTHWRREFAQLDFGRLIQDDVGGIDIPSGANCSAKPFFNP